jgi:ABC-2 type transport system permease protein
VKLAVGSWPWLLKHELTLALRATSSRRLWIIGILAFVVWLPAHFAAWIMLRGLTFFQRADALTPYLTLVGGTVVWVMVSLMLAQAIAMSVNVLFDRGDMDLLLSSPIEPRTVFTVRALGVALSCSGLYLVLASPFANVGLVTGHARLLALYPGVLALGLLVSAIAMWVTLSLVRLLGARRARVVAQVLGSLIGAAFFLITQSQTLISRETRAHALSNALHWFEPGAPLEPASAVWLPLRALLGEPVSLTVVIIVALGAFWLVVNLAHKRFLDGTQASITGIGKRAVASRGRTRFRSGVFRTVIIKEWTMIRRDPNLIAQTLLQTLYLLPMLFIVFRRDVSEALIATACILLATTLAGNLAWITVAAEDAPELVGAAPVPMTSIRWMKMLAAVIPVWVLLSPVFVVLVVHEPLIGLVFGLALAGSTLSAGVIQIWYPQRGRRSDLMRRAKSGGWLLGVLELVTALGWTGLAWTLLAAPLFSILAVPFAAAGPVLAWGAGRSRREGDVLV